MRKYMLCKIKPDKKDVWLDWCHEIIEVHSKESLETLIEEDLISEKCTVLSSEAGDYLIYEHESIDERKKKPANLDKELNKKHFEKFHECLELIGGKNILGYELRVP